MKKALKWGAIGLGGLFMLMGIVQFSLSTAILGVEVLTLVILVTNTGGVRSRVPLLRSANPPLAIIGWAILGLIFFAALGSTAPAVPRKDATVVKTAQVQPVKQPEAKSTNAPAPTNTPRPASTPKPQITPTSADAAEQAIYLTKLLNNTNTMQKSLTRFGELLGNMQILNAQWRLQMAAVLATWQVAYNEMKDVAPPTRFKAAHETYVAALEGYNDAANDIANGLDTMNAQTLNMAIPRMEGANKLLNAANKLITQSR